MGPMQPLSKPTFPWAPALAYAFGCGATAFALITMLITPPCEHEPEPEPRPDPEAAQFMIECAYEWGVAPERCREILRGELPPQEGDAYDEPGC